MYVTLMLICSKKKTSSMLKNLISVEMKSALRMRIFVFIYIHSCGFLLLKIYDNFFNLEQNKRRQLDEIYWIC